MLSVYVDDITLARLELAAAESGRKVEDLASFAIAEATLGWAKSRGCVKSSLAELRNRTALADSEGSKHE